MREYCSAQLHECHSTLQTAPNQRACWEEQGATKVSNDSQRLLPLRTSGAPRPAWQHEVQLQVKQVEMGKRCTTLASVGSQADLAGKTEALQKLGDGRQRASSETYQHMLLFSQHVDGTSALSAGSDACRAFNQAFEIMSLRACWQE